jgi:hypothetical protein
MADQTRREAVRILGLAAGAALSPQALGIAEAEGKSPSGATWVNRMRRCFSVQFNERDPLNTDLGWWVDYCSSLKLDAIRINAGGIMAFYPTEVPYHHRSKYLGDRDLFGDLAKACKARGMRIGARTDPMFIYEDAAKAHPEWVARDENGQMLKPTNGLYETCIYSTYYTEQIPAIMREINARYDIDCFFTNTFPGARAPRDCYCDACSVRKLDPGSPEAYQRHLDRVNDIWRLWDKIAKEKRPENLYVLNLGSGMAATVNLPAMSEGARWVNNDHQGRPDNGPIWDAAQQGRASWGIMKGRTTSIVVGAYSTTNRPYWRWTSKAPLEMKMWMNQATASGQSLLLHWPTITSKDMRWARTGRDFFQWHAQHEAHLTNEAPLANIAMVWSQRSAAYYKGPTGKGGTRDYGETPDYTQGLYQALLENRFLFDVVHEDDLTPETLSKYRALVLGNCACLSDRQCQQLRDYAGRGGSLLATFETGFYDEAGKPRAESGLADLFDFRRSAPVAGPDLGEAIAMNIERDHPLLKGFSQTTLLPLSEYYVPLQPISNPVVTILPTFPTHPMELIYLDQPRTDQPAVMLTERGASRRVYFAGDIDRSFFLSQHPDLSQLLGNAIRWMVPDAPISVTGDGFVEIFAWKTKPGYALHLLNYNNPQTMRGTYTKVSPLGPQSVKMTLPAGTKVLKIQLLVAGTEVPFTRTGDSVAFTVPLLADYEVAAIV